jgi:hypothetical protein
MTAQMNESITLKCKVEDIIKELKFLDVDGETMQYILEKVGMEDQMLRQLVMKTDSNDVTKLLFEKLHLSDIVELERGELI